MTDIIDGIELPEFPAARAAGCPFDPPPAIQGLQEQTPITRVRLEDGKTPWLVTRYADQRAVLGDPRISSDPSHPGYPRSSAGDLADIPFKHDGSVYGVYELPVTW